VSGSLLRGLRVRVGLSLLLGVLTVLAGAGLLYTSGLLISRAALHPPTLLALMTLITGVRFFGLARAGVRYAERLVSHDLTLRFLGRLRVRLFATLAPLGPGELLGGRAGDLLARVGQDVETLQNAYLRLFAPLVVAALTTLVAVALLLPVSPPLALVTLLLLAASGALLPLLAHRLARADAAARNALHAELTSELLERLRGAGDLLALTPRTDLDLLNGEGERLERRRARLGALLGAARDLLSGAGLWASLLVVGASVAAGETDGARLAAVALFVLASFEGAANLAGAGLLAGEVGAAGARVQAVEGWEARVKSPAHPQPVPADPTLRFEGVTFAYEERVVLRDLDLTLRPGERVAVLGPSGAGKSTLASLALRFYDPQGGRVTLGGVDLRALDLEAARSHLSWAGQDPHLFDATLRENLFAEGASDARLTALLHKLGLGELLERLPGSLDAWVGEHGAQLSGGERARIALSRALLKPGAVVILDEPTAHLDADTEREVMRAVLEELDGRALLLITHRPGALVGMDRVVRLEAGRCGDYGTGPR